MLSQHKPTSIKKCSFKIFVKNFPIQKYNLRYYYNSFYQQMASLILSNNKIWLTVFGGGSAGQPPNGLGVDTL